MPEFPLLGCLQGFTVSASSDGALIIEGPLFTTDKINLNGWGIPAEEAETFAATFAGKPVRWCPHGKDIIPGVPAEHYCDAVDSTKTIVGTILSVYATGLDPEGRIVYKQRAKITDPKTVKGIQAGEIPANVSMWAYAKECGDDGLMRGCRGESESIVTEPAYQEAAFNWQAVAASFASIGGRMNAAKSFPYVPNNPSDYKKSTGTWAKPSLKDFTSELWDDLSDAERNKIRSCFAAVTGETFGDCKLPHHEPDGTLNANGVRNALARFDQTQGLGTAKDAAKTHLEKHLAEFKEKGASASMPDEPIQTTLSGVTPPATAPGVTINIASGAGKDIPVAAAAGDGNSENNAVCAKCSEKIPAFARFCPACGTGLHASCGACGSTLGPADKFCSSCGTEAGKTVGDNSVAAAAERIAQDRVKVLLEENKRKDLASSIVAAQIRVGTLTDANKDKRTTELIAMPASVLETMLGDYCIIAEKMGKPVEQGLRSGQIPAAAGASKRPNIPMPANADSFLNRFKDMKGVGLTWDDIGKYGPGGTYHQARQNLEA
jgi:hypothetical protein